MTQFRLSRRAVAALASALSVVAIVPAVGAGDATAAGSFHPAKPHRGRPVPTRVVPHVVAPPAPASSRSVVPARPVAVDGTRHLVALDRTAPVHVVRTGHRNAIARVTGGWQPAAGTGPDTVRVAAAAASAPSRIAVRVLGNDPARSAALALEVGRADGRAAAAPVAIRVPDALLAGRYGADYASRVQWVQVPAAHPMAAGRPVPQIADPADRATVLTPQVSGEQTMLVAQATTSSSSGTGDFGSASLKSSTSWQVSQQTGAFTWRDPLPVPPSAAGPAPDVSLGYDSQPIDGETGSTNNQTGDEGEGWSLAAAGAISRTYASCATNDGPGGAIKGSGDLCWGTDNATISFAGHAGALVPVGDGTWHIQGDDGTRVQYLTGATNGTDDGDYWKVTTTDGRQYFFGLNHLPGWATGDRTTNSAYTVPVCGTATTACSGTATAATPFHVQAWKWNLDYVVDVHGNAEAFYYTQQANRYAKNGSGSTSYVRGGALTEIDYGLRSGNLFATTSASDKVLLGSVARCETGISGEPTGACSTSTPTASYWPDVPWDQNCTSTTSCTQKSPTFWSTTMLSTVTTEYLSGSSYAKVDTWTLGHSWPSPGDGTSPALWLTQVAHTGYSGSTSLATPTITFSGITMQNRVWTVNGLAPLDKYRISSIRSDAGALLTVSYSPQQCTPSMVSSLDADPADNTNRCFPQWWAPKTTPPQPAGLDWFHKYLVTAVYADPVTGGTDDLRTETDYVYTGTPAWRFNTAPGLQDSERTWSDWAGYDTVEVRVGDANHPALQRTTDYVYFRGLDGDADGPVETPTSSLKSVTLTSSTNVKVVDKGQWAGQIFETTTRLGSSGGTAQSTTPVLTDSVSVPWSSPATASVSHSYTYTDPVSSKTYSAKYTSASYFTGTASTATTAGLSGGGTRTSTTSTSYDDTTGLPTMAGSHTYDTAKDGTVSGSQSTCTTTTYAASNTTAWLIGLPARTLKVGVACGAGVTYPAGADVSRADVLQDSATYYDGTTTVGAMPTKGEVTQTSVANGYSGTSPKWLVAGTASYDPLGRLHVSVDPNAPGGAATTTTNYVPTGSGPTTSTSVVNTLGWTTTTTYAPAWGEPTSVTDQNGGVTTGAYDALGRLVSVWLPNRPTSSTPSKSYAYSVSTTAPSAVATTVLTPSGGTRVSYVLFDGLGRVRQSQDPAEGGGIDVVDTSYDGDGQASVVSAPYYATGTPSTKLITPTTTLPSQTQTVYDGAGRVTDAIQLVDGHEAWRTSTTYSGADRTDVAPPDGGIPTTTYTNPQGRTSRFVQTLSATSSTSTSYAYDAGGEMTSMKDGATNAWSWTYDLRGNLLRSVDPDSGAVSATFDSDGNAITTTDAVGNVVTYSYDQLGRKTAEYTGSGPSLVQVASWDYDKAYYNTSTTKHDLGLVSSATSYTGGTAGQPGSGTAYSEATNAYDTLGNPLKQTTTVGGTTPVAGTYVTSYGYDADGSLAYQIDPAAGGLPSEKILTGYDSLGNPASLGTTSTYFVSSVTYTHLNQIAQVAQIQHAQVYQTPSYDPGTGRLTEYLVQRSASTDAVVADDHYVYDAAGLLTEDQNVTPATGTDTQCYLYDHLQNLSQAWTPSSNSCTAAPSLSSTFGGPAPYWTSYDVDPATGNRTDTTSYGLDATSGAVTGSDTATYHYPVAGSTPGSTGPGMGGPNAVSVVTHSSGAASDSYAYDLDGSTTSLPGHVLTYDGQEHPTTQRVGSTSESSVYDADGTLLLTDDAVSGTTLYLGDTQVHAAPGAAAGATTGSRTYTLAGKPFAERDTTVPGSTTSTLSFLAANPQGTASAAVNDATSAVTRRYFDPFGKPRGSSVNWPDSAAGASLGNHGFLNAANDLLTSAAGSGTDALTQLGAREYDPTLGRFLTVDPVTDTNSPQQVNGYAYANNTPTNTSDAAGTDPPPIGCENTACYNCLYADIDCGQMKQAPVVASPTSGGSGSSGGGGGSDPTRNLPHLTPKQIATIRPILHMFITDSPKDCATNWQQSTCWNNPASFSYQALMERIRHVIYGGPSWSDILHAASSAAVGFLVGLAGVALCGETAGAGCLAAAGAISGLASQCVSDCTNATALGLSAIVGAVTGGVSKLDGDPAYSALEKDYGDPASQPGEDPISCSTGNSFTGDTPVQLAGGGTKPIADVRVGDLVLATDPLTGRTATERVTALIRHRGPHAMVRLAFADGSTLQATDHHSFWDVTTGGWTPADEVQPGDRVRTADGALLVVQSRVDYVAALTAYNLEVADLHVYFVGRGAVLVHNGCGGETSAAARGREIHNEFDDALKLQNQNGGTDWQPGLKTGANRPDGFYKGDPIELKPNSPSGIRAGLAQLQRYMDAFDRKTGYLYTYDSSGQWSLTQIVGETPAG